MRGQHRHVELGEFALLEDVGWIDQDRGVPQDSRAVEDEPGDGQPEEERDVDGFAEAAAGALVLDGVEQANEFVLLEFSVAVGAEALGRARRLARLGWRIVRDERERGVWIWLNSGIWTGIGLKAGIGRDAGIGRLIRRR